MLEVSVGSYDPDPRWRHAGGAEDWVVWCEACQTVDDDGERMMACDVCGVWKHTRCVGGWVGRSGQWSLHSKSLLGWGEAQV